MSGCCSLDFWFPCCQEQKYIEELRPLRSPSVFRVAGGLILSFTLICGMLSFRLGYDTIFVSVLIVMLLFVDIGQSSTLPHEHLAKYDSRPMIVMLGVITVVLAGVVGVENYNTNSALRISAKEGRAYTGVSSDEDAAVYADAGTITFRGSMLDDKSAVGLKGFSGTACVVPIVKQRLPVSGKRPKVQFWAVGTDCCERRADFACDSALDLDVQGGIVVHPASEETASALFEHKAVYEQYITAISAAAALYNLDTASPPLLVRWVASPEDVLREMNLLAWVIYVVSSIIHGIIFTAAYILIKLNYEGKLMAQSERVARQKAGEDMRDVQAGRSRGPSSTRDVFLLTGPGAGNKAGP